MRERDLDAIGMPAEPNVQTRMVFAKVLERLLAGGYDRFLQLRGGVIFQTSAVREITRDPAHRGR